MSARSYGSVRRLKILGTREVYERLAQIRSVPWDPLLHEHELPVVVAQADQLLVVVAVEERLARALRRLARSGTGSEVVAVEVDLVGHVADLVALEELLLHVGSPAMARSVGSQSWWPTISFETVPALILPGQRTMHGTRKAPSQLVFFSLRNGVIAPSGQVFMCGPLSVRVHDDRVVGDAQCRRAP